MRVFSGELIRHLEVVLVVTGHSLARVYREKNDLFHSFHFYHSLLFELMKNMYSNQIYKFNTQNFCTECFQI